jgi:hypothetical protein
MRRIIAAFGLAVVLTGCSAPIPNKVSPDEYEIYSQWMKGYFSKAAPANLYIQRTTFTYDPLENKGACGGAELHKDGVPWSLLKEIHTLGEAAYPLDVNSPTTKLRIPWKYGVVDDWPGASPKPGGYDMIAFSRVAFNRGHTEALFAIDDVCGGLCGHGGYIRAHKESNTWVFRPGECAWVY